MKAFWLWQQFVCSSIWASVSKLGHSVAPVIEYSLYLVFNLWSHRFVNEVFIHKLKQKQNSVVIGTVQFVGALNHAMDGSFYSLNCIQPFCTLVKVLAKVWYRTWQKYDIARGKSIILHLAKVCTFIIAFNKATWSNSHWVSISYLVNICISPFWTSAKYD